MSKTIVQQKKFVPALGFNFLTRLYDPIIRVTTKEEFFKEELVRNIIPPPQAEILDLACGTGTLTTKLALKFNNCSISAVDADQKVLKQASQKAKALNLNIQFHEGYSYQLPFESGKFDIITSSLFFHHLTDREKGETLKNIKRILKSDGVLWIADFGRPKNIFTWLGFCIVRWLDGFSVTKANRHGYLKKIIHDSGFSNVTEKHIVNSAVGSIYCYECKK